MDGEHATAQIAETDFGTLNVKSNPATARRPKFGIEPVDALLDPFGDRRELLVGASERIAGDRIVAHPDQKL
ncbi:hypothetical protein [Streptomyces millisiae]|uniref:Uncharacterized protein n=1 Tax=Streptomyces millisiae TaxID=3075542 RepID=A0ABU2M188_9ACTN|nr:hypothetical protein [Streptomyces sp. DSM 44918]MDT0323621.1 hypothetical protein [Streptomyces sp. DSM 44918]